MATGINRNFCFVVAVIGVVAFGIYSLSLGDAEGSRDTQVALDVAASTPATTSNSTEPFADGGVSAANERRARRDMTDAPLMREGDVASLSATAKEIADRKAAPFEDPLDQVADDIAQTAGVVDPPEPDIVLDEVDPALISDELLAKYETGGHSRFRFVEIDGERLRAALEGMGVGDALHIELFPGEVVSPVRSATDNSLRTRADGSVTSSSALQGHPCSVFNLSINAQGAIDVSSFHRQAPVFAVEQTDHDGIYAITQTTNDNAPTCGD